ncbi:hypothetical protein MWN34_00360 [Ancylobacter sp. 6x-1]|uniref:Uncharacterized protein n=1 Tax=Ancylobacter crimeensis TaxID=2579147 RepID=A0ABT0D5Y7_9HYPH|nr:hypothetical protein [Ancylobacter crimeensis]MCK0195356.1 hypothetical protein [Ancylobacter crimeensis]
MTPNARWGLEAMAVQVLRAGLILLDAAGTAVQRVISLQYNPDTLSRTLTPRGTTTDSGDRLEATRLKGPPVETIKLDAEIDAADQLEHPRNNPDTVANGIQPELAAIETIIVPRSADIQAAERLAASGTIEILPLPSSLVLFVFGPRRVLPVRVQDMSVLEEAFDANLSPIRAKIGLTLRVLSVDDLAPGTRGAGLAMAALSTREQIAKRQPATLSAFGLRGLP